MQVRSAAVQAARRAGIEPPPNSTQRAKSRRDFAANRLIRVRRLLNRIDAMLESESDPEEVERLCRSAKALSEQECYLSGRPRPGIRRVSSRDSQQQQPLPPPSEPS